jgi:tRNA (cytidine56-2'-O)-methyltransferase
MTSHVALVSRALGCQKIYMTYLDDSISKTVNDINKRWGGKDQFEIEYVADWRRLITSWKKIGGLVVHLTMYGINVEDMLPQIDIKRKILVVVGASKVPREVYTMANFNIAIGHQPHSEISALAIFLDRLSNGTELKKIFKDAKINIIPSKDGKNIRVN